MLLRNVKIALLLVISGLISPMMWEPGAQAKVPKIIVLGDSLVAGYRLPPGAGFPQQLQKNFNRLKIRAVIISAGVSGDTTTGGLARLDWSVPEGTDGVILELGANDALRGLPVRRARKNLDAMIARLKARNIAVMLVGMRAPPNMGEDYQHAFDAIYPVLARKHGIMLYPFFLEGVAANPALNLADGIHPNQAGIAIMIKKFTPYAKRFVEKLATNN